jgi:hypothetical protein
VVLSDLHFGAANSTLSHVVAGQVDPHEASSVLAGLLDGLEALSRGSGTPPTLVLAGDILDLALSSDNVAAMVFERFATCAAAGKLFADPILLIPGNHDHHLWEMARETQYVAYLGTHSRDRDLDPAWHTTRMLTATDPQPVPSRLLEALIQRATGTSMSVRAVYPNLALRNEQRAVVISHGHFTEPLYTLVSALKTMLFPEQRTDTPTHVWEWEAENFAWIDFFWSALGRSGQAGEDVGLIYSELASAPRMRHLAQNFVHGLLNRQRGPSWLHDVEARAATPLINSLVRRASGLERGQRGVVLSPRTRAGTHRYLAGPVLDQLTTELAPNPGDKIPDDVTFIFGHTHKPFEEYWEIPGYAKGVHVVNTGGWVVDTATPEPAHGAAIVLVSTDLDVASIRVYNQRDDGAAAPVVVSGRGEWSDELRATLRLDAEPWTGLGRVAATAVANRHALSAEIQRGSPA